MKSFTAICLTAFSQEKPVILGTFNTMEEANDALDGELEAWHEENAFEDDSTHKEIDRVFSENRYVMERFQ